MKNSNEANSKDDVVSSDCFPLPKRNDENASDTEVSDTHGLHGVLFHCSNFLSYQMKYGSYFNDACSA